MLVGDPSGAPCVLFDDPTRCVFCDDKGMVKNLEETLLSRGVTYGSYLFLIDAHCLVEVESIEEMRSSKQPRRLLLPEDVTDTSTPLRYPRFSWSPGDSSSGHQVFSHPPPRTYQPPTHSPIHSPTHPPTTHSRWFFMIIWDHCVFSPLLLIELET